MVSIRSWVLITSLLVFFGCAKQPGNDSAYQSNSSNCSFEFINDYNKVESSTGTVEKLETLVNSFEAKYKDVVCQAALVNSFSVDDTPVTITANSKIAEWRGLIADAKAKTKTTAATTSTSTSTYTYAPASSTYKPIYPGNQLAYEDDQQNASDYFVEEVNKVRQAFLKLSDSIIDGSVTAATIDKTRTVFTNFGERFKSVRCYVTMTSGSYPYNTEKKFYIVDDEVKEMLDLLDAVTVELKDAGLLQDEPTEEAATDAESAPEEN